MTPTDTGDGTDSGPRDTGVDVGWDGSCFAAGTPVATPSGPVAIERLAVGDLVWSFDEARARQVPGRVARVFVHADSVVRRLQLDNDDALLVTDEHPFYAVDERRYVHARELVAGQRLLTRDGVIAVERWGARQRVEHTYNIEVTGLHNYFANGVLVHNKTDIPIADVPCGDTLCTRDSTCVIPCCETDLGECQPRDADGRCPRGWWSTTCADGGPGCEPPCEPPAADGTCPRRMRLETCPDGSEGCRPDPCAAPYCEWGLCSPAGGCELPAECIDGTWDGSSTFECMCSGAMP